MRLLKKTKESFKSAHISIIKELMERHADCLIIDVRNPSEYKAVHIQGVINIPLNQIKNSIGKFTSDKNKPIYVHCAYGNRSREACTILVKMGYTDITNLGGIIDWPYDIVSKKYNIKENI